MSTLKIIMCVLSFVLFPLLVAGCDSKDEPVTVTLFADAPSKGKCQQVTIGMTTDQAKALLGEPGATYTSNGVFKSWGWCIESCDSGLGMFKASFEDGKVSEVEFLPDAKE